jgi:hypothetical protein
LSEALTYIKQYLDAHPAPPTIIIIPLAQIRERYHWTCIEITIDGPHKCSRARHIDSTANFFWHRYDLTHARNAIQTTLGINYFDERYLGQQFDWTNCGRYVMRNIDAILRGLDLNKASSDDSIPIETFNRLLALPQLTRPPSATENSAPHATIVFNPL